MVSVSELLTAALEFEREGRLIYLDAGRRVRDTVVRAVLVALANDEGVHEKLIQRYYEAMERHESWPQADTEMPLQHPARQRLEEILSETAGSLGPDATFLRVYEEARELEMRSRDFYRSHADAAQDGQLVRFLRFLAGMEQTHLEMLALLLEATRESAESPNRGESPHG